MLVLDRAVIDNFAYFLRVTKGQDPFDVTPLVAKWSTTYDLYVRLRPDTPLIADGVRSTNERFRNEIEKILDMIIPKYVPDDRLIEMPASAVTDAFDWPGLVERLCGPRRTRWTPRSTPHRSRSPPPSGTDVADGGRRRAPRSTPHRHVHPDPLGLTARHDPGRAHGRRPRRSGDRRTRVSRSDGPWARRQAPTRMSFLLTNSSAPHRPSSRPEPERFTPPKGSSGLSAPTMFT